MSSLPLKITGKCVAEDETLFANMDAAIARGYPQIKKRSQPRPARSCWWQAPQALKVS
jgi:hypothetical protein